MLGFIPGIGFAPKKENVFEGDERDGKKVMPHWGKKNGTLFGLLLATRWKKKLKFGGSLDIVLGKKGDFFYGNGKVFSAGGGRGVGSPDRGA